ncbi:MAG: hypothetical protein FJ314_06800 [SAR202 cluster bacterium]|nr:hypothetical protein [SAR202 cluster bacterium]
MTKSVHSEAPGALIDVRHVSVHEQAVHASRSYVLAQPCEWHRMVAEGKLERLVVEPLVGNARAAAAGLEEPGIHSFDGHSAALLAL